MLQIHTNPMSLISYKLCNQTYNVMTDIIYLLFTSILLMSIFFFFFTLTRNSEL